MFTLKFLVKWITEQKAQLFIDGLFTFSLIFVADFSLSLYLSTVVGVLPVLLLALITNLVLYLLLMFHFKEVDRKLNKQQKNSIYSEATFVSFFALYGIAGLLLALGPLSKLLAFILLYPLRSKFGNFLSQKAKIDWKDAYEFINMINK